MNGRRARFDKDGWRSTEAVEHGFRDGQRIFAQFFHSTSPTLTIIVTRDHGLSLIANDHSTAKSGLTAARRWIFSFSLFSKQLSLYDLHFHRLARPLQYPAAKGSKGDPLTSQAPNRVFI